MLSYLVSRSRAVVLGAHGPIPPFVDEAFALDYPSIVASADVDMFALSPGMPQKGTALVLGVSKKDVKICRLRFVSE